ncbi:MAG: sugar transferase, partial [Verrucomicrobiales bacterium]|nr:sugar transferase [Verrucomicrobiales bacterium]
MLRRQRIIRNRIHKGIDGGLFAVGFYLAFILRSNAELIGSWLMRFFELFGGTREIQSLREILLYIVLTVPSAMVLLGHYGFYNRPLISSRRQTALALFKVCTVLTIGVITVMFLTRFQLARAVVILFGVFSFILVMLKEELVRWWIRAGLEKGYYERRLLLVGTAEDTATLSGDLHRRDRHGIRIVGHIDVNEASVDQFVDLLHEHSPNSVVVAARNTVFGQLEKVIQACELEGVEVWLIADFFNTQISKTTVDDLYGRPMMVFRSTPEDSWQGVGKQLVDTCGAAILIVLASPIMALAALAVRLTSPGPVIFRQLRSGLNGRPFTMYKFRTMVTDAEQRKQELAAFNEMSGPVFKVTN